MPRRRKSWRRRMRRPVITRVGITKKRSDGCGRSLWEGREARCFSWQVESGLTALPQEPWRSVLRQHDDLVLGRERHLVALLRIDLDAEAARRVAAVHQLAVADRGFAAARGGFQQRVEIDRHP